MKKWFFWRKGIQFIAIGALCIQIWFSNPIWFGTYLSAQIFMISLTDPLAALEVILAGKELWLPLLWSAVPLVAIALAMGRIFCSWICPLHTLLEAAALIKTPKVNRSANTYLPYFIMAGCLLLAFVFSLPFYTMLSPIGMISRLIVFGVGFEVVLLVFIVLAEWLVGQKTWCRNFCPLGALYGLLGRWKVIGITINHADCTQCGRCRSACTMNIQIGSNELLDVLNCTSCGACMDVCRKKSVYFSWRNRKGGRKHCEFVESSAG